jgi:hypothetical protein
VLKKQATIFWDYEDDLMGLTSTSNALKDLIIAPILHSNIARFINSPSTGKGNVHSHKIAIYFFF